jgi:hypothetical protein
MSAEKSPADIIPLGALDSREAFDQATHIILAARRATDAALVYGGLLRLRDAFALLPSGSTVAWHRKSYDISRYEIAVSSPAGTLHPDTEARILYHFENATTGTKTGSKSPSAILDGPQANLATYPWRRPAIDHAVLAGQQIERALHFIQPYAYTFMADDESDEKYFRFKLEDASLGTLAKLLGVGEALSLAESIILDQTADPSNPRTTKHAKRI